MRTTIKELRYAVETINEYLEADGILLRFEVQGRNGYQAVDEYKVNADGTSGGCTRMIGGGTSREVIGYCWEAYGHLSRAAS